jgi:hypothetical protein
MKHIGAVEYQPQPKSMIEALMNVYNKLIRKKGHNA